MVVLSAAVTTKGGKVLLARQFVPMTRIRVESLLAAFPKLIGSGDGASQHTFIETEHVRYLYQPIEGLYVVMITNKSSNIKEDLDSLRMLGKLVPEYCNGNDEESVSKSAFQLVYAIDELISIGYKEYVTLTQIRTFTDMDSHEEKLQNIIRESKETEQKHLIKEQAQRLEKQKLETVGFGGFGNSSKGTMAGFGSSSSPSGFGFDNQAPKSGYGGSSYNASSSSSVNEDRSPPRTVPAPRTAKDRKGMDLKGKKKDQDALSEFGDSAGLESFKAEAMAQSISSKSQSTVSDSKVDMSGVHVVVEERLALSLDRDGVLKKVDIRGELKIVITDPDYASVAVNAQMPAKNNLVRYTAKPVLDKKSLGEGQIRMKGSKGFAVGRDNANSVLKWRIASEDEGLVPLQLTVWPAQENGKSVVSAEFNGSNPDIVLKNVFISIPCFSKEPPSVSQIDGSYTFDPREHTLTWHIDEVTSESSGSLEFTIKEVPQDKFFPVNVTFTSDTLFSGVVVEGVINADTSAPVDYSAENSVIVEEYSIQ